MQSLDFPNDVKLVTMRVFRIKKKLLIHIFREVPVKPRVHLRLYPVVARPVAGMRARLGCAVIAAITRPPTTRETIGEIPNH